MSVYISGSLAYDRIMHFEGIFSDHIMVDKIDTLNVSFTINEIVESPGGTAGNIAYALALLEERSVILSSIGFDYKDYFQWLDKHGIPSDSIQVVPEERTATAYITTDLMNNQITAFYSGAMKYPSFPTSGTIDFGMDLGIVSPGNLADMQAYSEMYKQNRVPYIFDPGQSLPAWNTDELIQCMMGSKILIANDYEMKLVTEMTGINKEGFLDWAEIVITTKGEEGSLVATQNEIFSITATKPDRVVDPTGAGDAFRGGIIKGLVTGQDIRTCALMGSVCASFAVEVQGSQEYSFKPEEFQERLEGIL